MNDADDLALWLAVHFGAARTCEVRTKECDEYGFPVYRQEPVPDEELRNRTPMVTFTAGDGCTSLRSLTWAEIASAVAEYRR